MSFFTSADLFSLEFVPIHFSSELDLRIGAAFTRLQTLHLRSLFLFLLH